MTLQKNNPVELTVVFGFSKWEDNLVKVAESVKSIVCNFYRIKPRYVYRLVEERHLVSSGSDYIEIFLNLLDAAELIPAEYVFNDPEDEMYRFLYGKDSL